MGETTSPDPRKLHTRAQAAAAPGTIPAVQPSLHSHPAGVPLMETKTPTHEAEKHFMDWLRDAHAMEEQAESMLEGMASRLEHYPDLKRRGEQHSHETRAQARLAKQCIGRRGGDTSVPNGAAGQTMGAAQACSGMLAGDEGVKGAMFGYTFEHMEIAAYRTLIEASKVVGDIQPRPR